jgi:hypothetical protein
MMEGSKKLLYNSSYIIIMVCVFLLSTARSQDINQPESNVRQAPQLSEPPDLQPREPNTIKFSGPGAESISLTPDTAIEFAAVKPFSKIYVANPNVVDLVPKTDRTIILVGRRVGNSNVIITDDKGSVLHNLYVNVDSFPGTYVNINIHNKALLNSKTVYRCGPSGCYYTGELTVDEPSRLPPGYSVQKTQNVNTNYSR